MGEEYLGLASFQQMHRIKTQYSCPRTSAQNGRAERKHRHIVETCLTLLAQSKVPLKYWPKAFLTAIFLINRLLTPVLDNMCPLEKLQNKKPNYKSLKIFGCACFPYLRPYQTQKFQYHSTKWVFLGYSSSHKGYKCLSSTGKFYISRHVVFNEKHFPFHTNFLNTKTPEIQTLVTTPYWLTSTTEISDINLAPNTYLFDTNSQDVSIAVKQVQEAKSRTLQPENYDMRLSAEGGFDPQQSDFGEVPGYVDDQAKEAETNESKMHQRPIEIQQQESQQEEGYAHRMTTRAKAGIHKPKQFSSDFQLYLAKCSEPMPTEPISINEALNSKHWKSAMEEELKALKLNNTWSLVLRTPSMNIVGSKWVFRVKKNYRWQFPQMRSKVSSKGVPSECRN